MNTKYRYLIIIVAILMVVGTWHGTSAALTGGSGGGVEGEPPNGLAISSNAPGTKLVGVMAIEYINYHWQGGQDYAETARVVMRLKKGSDLEIFYDEVPGPMSPEVDPFGTQQLIMGKLSDAIITAFFPGETGLEGKVKLMTNFMTIKPDVSYLSRDAIAPGYGTCETVSVCTLPGVPQCDTDPTLWVDILSCEGDYEFCGNGIDDNGDLRPDTDVYPHLNDPECAPESDGYKRSVFVVTDIELAIK